MYEKIELLNASLDAIKQQLDLLRGRPREERCAPEQVRRILMLFMDASYAMGQLSERNPDQIWKLQGALRQAARSVYRNSVPARHPSLRFELPEPATEPAC